MLGSLKMCYACLEMNGQELIDVTTLDFDGTSFLYKLQMCVTSTLEEDSSKLICAACIKQLRISYKFRETVLLSQQVLQKRKNSMLLGSREGESTRLIYKVEIDRQFFDSECLIVKNDTVDLDGDRFTQKATRNLTELSSSNGDGNYSDYCFLNIKDEEPAQVNNVKSSATTKEDVLDQFHCVKCDTTLKSWNFHQHTCAGYNSDYAETKEVKLKCRRGRTKKNKIIQPEIEYECYHCCTVFNKRWKLQKHITRVHTDKKKHICSYCEKAFKQSYHLREHLTSHTGERNYTCSFCDKTFQRISSMKRHVRSHERAPGEKTKKTPFLCTVCGKNFPFSNGVQRHMRIHFGIRNHECSICQRRFTQSTHLHVHMRTHTGEKPYICDTCGDAFSLNASLQKHMTIHKSRTSDDDNILVKMCPDSN